MLRFLSLRLFCVSCIKAKLSHSAPASASSSSISESRRRRTSRWVFDILRETVTQVYRCFLAAVKIISQLLGLIRHNFCISWCNSALSGVFCMFEHFNMFIHLSSSLNATHSFIHDTAIRESSTHICTGTNPTDTHPCMRARTHTVCSCWGDCELRFKNKSSQKASGSLTTWNLCIRHHWSRGTSVKEHRQLIGRPRRADRWPLPRRLHHRDLDSVSLSHCANVSHTQTPSHTQERHCLLKEAPYPTRCSLNPSCWRRRRGRPARWTSTPQSLSPSPFLFPASLAPSLLPPPHMLTLTTDLAVLVSPRRRQRQSSSSSAKCCRWSCNAAEWLQKTTSVSFPHRRLRGKDAKTHTHRCTHTLERWHNERVCSGFVRVRGRRCFNRPDWRVITQICWETAAEGIWRF